MTLGEYLREAREGRRAVDRRFSLRQVADPDLVLARVGKISGDLREIILDRPRLFTVLIRQLREAPDDEIRRITRQVRDGEW